MFQVCAATIGLYQIRRIKELIQSGELGKKFENVF